MRCLYDGGHDSNINLDILLRNWLFTN